jgi:hypothetical protein
VSKVSTVLLLGAVEADESTDRRKRRLSLVMTNTNNKMLQNRLAIAKNNESFIQ